ncbi:MAG TPA: hypothetical protein VN750_27220 [Steroidobacteraceae bacterium]|nr:hypothetical protein [Steroidobacteraceae bacterium]
MSVHPTFLHRSAPSNGERIGWLALAFALIGGPGAWFMQICAGYMLANGPCFPHESRRIVPPHAFGWTWPALIALLILGVLIAMAAFAVAYGAWRRTPPSTSAPEDPATIEVIGRTRFLALWGMIYGASFAVATLVNAVAYILLPRCGG